MSIVLNQKGQLKIQQMSFMLLAVFLFFMMVLLFYVAVSTTNLKKEQVSLERDKGIGLAAKIASTAEFGFEGIPNSIDADKAMIIKNEVKYRDYWGINGIIIKKVYPASSNIECKASNYPDCDTIKIFTANESSSISSFVSLCRKQTSGGHSYNHCELAKIMIETK
ncbi:MAG: hypothetical protein WC781_04240 [Candidatus Pacearchaeota archaeon]|jgi:hypothetical protein